MHKLKERQEEIVFSHPCRTTISGTLPDIFQHKKIAEKIVGLARRNQI